MTEKHNSRMNNYAGAKQRKAQRSIMENIGLRMFSPTYVLLLLITFFSATAQAARICVPSSFDASCNSSQATIAAAITAATSGVDNIYVQAGIYSEKLTLGKSLTLLSASGAGSTKIQGDGTNAPVISISAGANGSTLDGFTIDNQATAGNASRGIIFNYPTASMSMTIQNSIINGNLTTATGAGVMVGVSSAGVAVTLNISNTTFSNNNSGAAAGAGLYISAGAGTTVATTLTNATFSGNTTTANGAGISLNGTGASITISGSSFNTNTAANGGAFANSGASGTGAIQISNTTFSDNSATAQGGAIYVTNQATTFTITGSTFSSTLASAAANGGAINCTGPAGGTTLTLTSSTFSGFTVTGNGGALYLTTNCTGTFSKNKFIGNKASGANGGGAIWVSNASGLAIKNSFISGNYATTSGGGIYIAGTSTSILVVNTTFAGNNAGSGGAIFDSNAGTNATVKSSVLWGDNGTTGAEIRTLGTWTVAYSDISNGGTPWAGTGNIDSAPNFTNAVSYTSAPTTSGDYHLQSGSAGIDVGASDADTPADDYDGDARPQNSVVDMGADEYLGASATTTLANGADPGNASLAPGGTATMADAFTLQTSTGTDAITAATVTVATGTSGGLSLVEITNDAGTTVYGSVTNPASDTPAINLTTNITATTTATQYKIRITPKSHANMPAPSGSIYSVTAYISNWTGTNTHAGSDSGGTTVTIDNLSPGNVTGATATAGDTQVSLLWTNPADADLNSIVVLRKAGGAVADTPVEGTTYSVGNTIGSSTVACVVAAPSASCTDTGLTNGAAYYYLIFTKDSNGNYSASGVTPSGSPATPLAAPSISSVKSSTLISDPVNGATNPLHIPGAIIGYQIQTANSGNGSPDADTVTVIDALDSTTLEYDVATGVTFAADTSGLTLGTVSYSHTSTPTTYTYTPIGPYDPNVAGIKVTTIGTFATGGANFTINFRARVR